MNYSQPDTTAFGERQSPHWNQRLDRAAMQFWWWTATVLYTALLLFRIA